MMAHKDNLYKAALLLFMVAVLSACASSKPRYKACKCPAYGYNQLPKEAQQANQQSAQTKLPTDAS